VLDDVAVLFDDVSGPVRTGDVPAVTGCTDEKLLLLLLIHLFRLSTSASETALLSVSRERGAAELLCCCTAASTAVLMHFR
jgi:hypothetical protein